MMHLRQRIALLCTRLAFILIGTVLLLMLPEPASGQVLYFKNALVAFISVILIGKTLFDTFFYNAGD